MVKSGSRYLALLRGINVGGKNIIPKDDLRQCFEDCGFTNVRTYIQSGNVLFRSKMSSVKKLTAEVQAGLAGRFDYDAQVVILPQHKYKSAVAAAPNDWGNDTERTHNAMFTLSCTNPKRVLAHLPAPKQGIEKITAGPGVIFWSVSKKQLSKSTMMKLTKAPVYRQVTVRNHNTVFKLVELFGDL